MEIKGVRVCVCVLYNYIQISIHYVYIVYTDAYNK